VERRRQRQMCIRDSFGRVDLFNGWNPQFDFV
jgi:hypothetical protein